MDAWIPGLITGTLSLLAAIATGILTSVLTARRERQKAERDARTPGVPTVQEIWLRQDTMERAFKASLVLLGESVEQHNNPGDLVFNQAAVKTLRDSGYMPSELEDVLAIQDPTKEK